MSTTIETSRSLVTEGVRISVRSIFVPEQSSLKHGNFVFAYRITIRNESNYTLQLLSRHWDILDGLGDRRVVEGDGVVGLQPVIEPNNEHTYMSGSVFPTPVGVMQGHYNMVRVSDGTPFQVDIPQFLLIAPFLLN